MMEEDPNDPNPDRMGWATTIAGYAIGGAIVFVMFYWSLPATSLN